MYETVRTVKGHEIYRMIGTRRCYHVDIKKGCHVSFKTVKAAVEYIETSL